MKVGIVLYPYGTSAKGLEQCVYETAKAVVAAGSDTSFTTIVPGSVSPEDSLGEVAVVRKSWLWRLLACLRHPADLFVFFTESAPLLLWHKSIVVFFDAAQHLFGERRGVSGLRNRISLLWHRMMLQRCRHVVAISESSKRDLVRYYGVAPDRVTVIHPGFRSFAGGQPAAPGGEANVPFFLYVGPLKERKNALRLVEAYDRFKSRTAFPHELVLVARQTGSPYERQVVDRIAQCAHRGSIRMRSGVSDAELQSLYRTAAALVYPSLLEGFGLPILEALSAQCMVVTSRTTSTAEVLGGAGILVDPLDVEDIAAALERVARGTLDRERFAGDAAAQCAKFSWERSGRAWNELLARLLAGKQTS